MFVRYLIVLVLLTYNRASASNVTFEEFPASYLKYVQGNSLWTGIFKECKKPTMFCIQNQVFKYLKSTLDYTGDVQFTPYMKFAQNTVDYNDVKRNLHIDNSTEEYYEDTSPLEDMSRSLQDDTLKFMMTHNLELQLPETIFQNAILKLSPRSIDGNGAMVKMEFLPPAEFEESAGEGRTIKKIKKFLGERLMYALMAILMVIKLLAVKFLFVLPAVMGVAAAKKLIFKLLLFVFPALHHLFKWCAYVPHGTKFHHHKHHIQHYHHVPPGHGHGHGHGHHGVEVIAPHSDGPPVHTPIDTYKHETLGPFKHWFNPEETGELQYNSGGPYFGGYITNRHDSSQADNEVYPWGQGQDNRRTKPEIKLPGIQDIENMVLKAEKEALIKARLQQEKLKIHEENLRLQEQLNNAIKHQEKLKQQANLVTKKVIPQGGVNQQGFRQPSIYLQSPPVKNVDYNKLSHLHHVNAMSPAVFNVQHNQVIPEKSNNYLGNHQQNVQISEAQQNQIAAVLAKKNREQLANQEKEIAGLIAKEQQQLQQKKQQQFSNHINNLTATSVKYQPTPYEKELLTAASITYDPFYSPILEKIDHILMGLGFMEEPCRERLICSMYKSPMKFSPHSNLLSAELSRDSNELQKPTATNAAVVRFYKYVQAARDGQDKRDCLRLYPTCAVNTEQ
ncbi:unnamed protein product [Brassicogethes aeneus]|uniref:Uncharacterized protein n=1 Tax=Brassicogethes aeneus TaxID=1431903 RepID=A0A9P0B269_BRAAE|nr:unnamed protein product [Brassicogethes aeneus]